MNAALFSKYPLSDTAYQVYEYQSLMYHGVIDAEINKNDINYHVFCTGFANWRHLDVMREQAAELSEYMNDVRNIGAEMDGETIILLVGDFNAGEKGDCVECIDYPENDNGTVWNTILDIDNEIYSIYEDNFNDNGTIPKCTSCAGNPRNDDDPDYVEYIGINALGFMVDDYHSSEYYMAKRGWVTEVVEGLNTSLTDKYAIIIYGDLDTSVVVGSTQAPTGDNDSGAVRICVYTLFLSIFAHFSF